MNDPQGVNEVVVSRSPLTLLLSQLDDDPQRSAHLYEEIRIRLRKYFECNRCHDPDSLVDETFDRVLKKIAEGLVITDPNRFKYFSKVASFVLKEEWKKKKFESLDTSERLNLAHLEESEPLQSAEEREKRFECLEDCLKKIDEEKRSLLVEYFSFTADNKKALHTEMAARLGISIEDLRVRIFRYKKSVQPCVRQCVSLFKEKRL